MKKMFSLILFVPIIVMATTLCCHGFFMASQKSSASASSLQNQFAQVKSVGVFLYKTPTLNESYINMHFEIPNTYFVKLLGDTNSYFYRAQYMEQIGYIKKIEVQPINGIPLQPYASATFRVFSSDGTVVRDAPFHASNAITTLPNNQTVLQYIGKISGEEAISGRGNTWYFCKFGNNLGYVYGGFCDMLSAISINAEVFEHILNPFITPSGSYIEYLKTSNIKFVIIAAVLLPALLIFYMLFMKIPQKAKLSSKTKIKKVKSLKPQYLFDDSEL